MADFLAQAIVQITADTKGFIAEMNKVVGAAEKKAITVKVVPTTVGFVNELRTQIKNMVLPTVKLQVRPDPVGFKTALRAMVKDAEKEIQAVVGFTPKQVTQQTKKAATGTAAAGGGVTKGGVVDKRVAQAELANAAATDAGVAARRRLTKELTEGQKVETLLTRTSLQLKTAEDAVTKAAISGVPALQAEAEALERVARASREAALARESRFVASQPPVEAPADAGAAAKAKIDAEADLLNARKITAAQFDAIEKDRIKAEEDATKAAEKHYKAETSAAEAAETATTKAKNTQIKDYKAATTASNTATSAAEKDAAKQIKARLAVKKSVEDTARSVVGLQSGAARTGFEKQIQPKILADDATPQAIAAAAATREVAIARKLLGQADAAVIKAEANLAAAMAGTDKVLQKNAALTLEAALAQQVLQQELIQTALTDEATAKGAVKNAAARARTTGAVSKAFTAQGAQMVGLRGAALSANAAFIAAAAGLILFTKAVEGATALQAELNVFAITAGASADEMARAGVVAQELGRDVTLPGVAASDAAVALTELAKAGLSVEDSLAGARGVLQLATAASIENAEATELAASAINAFGLAGGDAVHVADVLANAANESQGSIVDMGVALQQAATVARQAGLGLEQTVAVLTLFARAGLKGSDAGTSFRTMLLRLINPTAKAQRIMNKLGLTIRDEFGRIDLGQFFDDFAKSTENLTKRQQDQKLAIITGQDAIRGAAISLRAGSAGIDEYTKRVNVGGTAAEVAGARTQGFAGALENLKNQLSTSGTALTTALLPGLTGIADALTGVILGVTDAVSALKDLSQQAATPIDVVFNVIRKVTGASDPNDADPDKRDTKGLLGRIFDTDESGIEFVRDVRDLGVEALAALEESTGFEGVTFPTLTQARVQVQELITELNSSDFKNLDLHNIILEFKALQEEMSHGTFGTKEFAKSLGPFIEDLQRAGDAARDGIKIPPIAFPEILLPGAPAFEPGAKGAADNILETFRTSFSGGFFEVGKKAVQDVAEGMLDPGAQGAIAEAGQRTKEAMGREAGFEEEADIQTIQGASPAEQIALLRKRFANQQRIIDQARVESPISGVAGDALKRQRAARAKQAQITTEIKSVQEKAAADAKKKADDAEKAANEADQRILDALFPATRRLETRALIAEGTKQLNDDIAVAKAQIQNNLKRIAIIDKSFKDRQKAAELIADLRDANVKLTQEIAADVQGFFDAASTTFNLKLSAAQATGNFDRQIRLIDDRMKDLAAKLKNSKDLVGDARIQVQTELANLFNQRQEIQRSRVDEKIALGRSIFDLTGNKNPLLLAITAAVAITNKQIAEAKKAGRSTTVLKTVLNGYLQQRKDVLEDAAKEAKQGTTAFDLLSQFTETFNSIAGNLVGPDQPFISPSAFTAPIQPFLKRQKRQPGQFSFDTGGTPDSTDRAIQRLIDALDKNTAATQGNSAANGGTPFSMPNYVNVTGQRAEAMAKFWEARGAREATQG